LPSQRKYRYLKLYAILFSNVINSAEFPRQEKKWKMLIHAKICSKDVASPFGQQKRIFPDKEVHEL
jgi:hypothetical protein